MTQKIEQELAKVIPTECAEFIAHPHIVAYTATFPDGTTEERTGGCYTCQVALASREQGTSQIAEALIRAGIKNVRIDQTGGFTMVVYVGNPRGRQIGINAECIGIIENPDTDEESDFASFAEGTTPEQIVESARARLKGINQGKIRTTTSKGN